MSVRTLDDLAAQVRACRVCAGALPMEPRPVFQVSATARLLVASQAPGTRVQASGVPFSDPLGERLREWMAWAPAIQSIDDVRAFITDSQQRRARPGGSGEWVILLDGAPVGVVGCTALEWQDKRTSIGAWLGVQAQGRGVANRALKALIEQLFAAGIHRIEAFHAAGNDRSDAMLTRLGFTREGILRGHEWLHDEPVDDVVMSLLATDPRPGRP